MKIVCISDTHHRHKRLKVPNGDVLIHAGDLTGRGIMGDVKDFARWIKKLPHPNKIVIAGNHDWPFYEDLKGAKDALGDSCIYLQDSEVVVEGFKFYGMPWSPRFGNWAFYYDRGSKEAVEKTMQIPTDTDVLITHGPPEGILDLTVQQKHAGCGTILRRLWSLENLKAHIFGHIHEDRNAVFDEDLNVAFVNASVCTLGYTPSNYPYIIEIADEKVISIKGAPGEEIYPGKEKC